MGYGKLIARCNALQRTSGGEDFEELREILFKSSVFALIDHAARNMANAKFTEPHLLEFNLTLHAYEIEKE